MGFEPVISAGERPQTYALDRAATGTGRVLYTVRLFYICSEPVSITGCLGVCRLAVRWGCHAPKIQETLY